MKRFAVGIALSLLGPSALIKDTLAFVLLPPKCRTSSSSTAACRAAGKGSIVGDKLSDRSHDCNPPVTNHAPPAGGDDSAAAVADESRRKLLLSSLLVPSLALCLTSSPRPASANLMQFPCQRGSLRNTYHFMRAGESLLERDDMWGSNPLFLTNRENALSETGADQVASACYDMMDKDLNPSAVLYGLSANSIDTANAIVTEMKIGRNRVMPEYTNLDARGLGKWDMNARSVVEPAVWAMDATEAGFEGRDGLPPPNNDGTPNETLFNQVTRLRQLLSSCETTFSGDNVLLIFPDGTGPALLSCLIAGVPLSRVHELEYKPGEVRYDIGMESTLALLAAGPTRSYVETVERGKSTLKALRENPDLNVVNVKDKRIDDDMEAAEETRLTAERAAEESKTAAKRAAKERKLAEWGERRTLERERVAGVEAERQTRKELAAVDGSGDSPNLPDFTSVAALGLVASMASIGTRQVAEAEKGMSIDYPSSNNGSDDKIRDGKNKSAEEHSEVADVKALATRAAALFTSSVVPELKVHQSYEESGSDGGTLLNVPGAANVSHTLENLVQIAPELQVMEDLVQTAPIGIPEFSSSVPAFQDALDEEAWNKQDHQSEGDRKQMAEVAMEEYMNRDDGGDAWLDMMTGLMDEVEK